YLGTRRMTRIAQRTFNRMKNELKEHFSKAVKLHESGELLSARTSLTELADKDPESATISATLGHVCWDMQLLEEAVVAFSRAVKLSPKFEGASLGLFNSLWRLGRREEALKELERFQAIADSEDYREIIKEINEKW